MPGTPLLSRRDLEELLDAGQTVKLHVLGLATIAFPWRPRRLPGGAGGQGSLATGTTTEPSHGAGRPVDVNITTSPKGSHGRPPRRRDVARIRGSPAKDS